MEKFYVDSVSWNEKRTELYLKSFRSTEYFILDFIGNTVKVFKKDKIKIARFSDCNAIQNDSRTFFTQLFKMGHIEFWVMAYFDMMDTIKNYSQTRYGRHRYEKMRRIFGGHDDYNAPDSVFSVYSPIVEKLAKQGLVLKDFYSLKSIRENSNESLFNNKYNLSQYRKNPFEVIKHPTSPNDYCQKVDLPKYIESLKLFKSNPFLESLVTYISANEKGNTEEGVIRNHCSSNKEDYDYLINTCLYEPKRLVKYLYEDIKWQGMTFSLERGGYYYGDNPLRILKDYATMSYELYKSSKFDKYPKYLKTQHDIIQMNYKVKEDEIKTAKFKEAYQEYISWNGFTTNKSKFCISLPETPHDLVMEGTNLHHCVASYIDNVVRKETLIVFVREKENEKESFITLEIKDKRVHQAKGAFNRIPSTKEEIGFINSFAKEFNIEGLEESA
jgi:hypothetical protein